VSTVAKRARVGRTPRKRGRTGGQDGFILIAALWLLVALGAVGLHVGIEMRTERLAAANLLDEQRAREAAFAGAEYARSRLTAALLDRADELRAEAARANQRTQQNQRGQQQQRNRTQTVQQLFRSASAADDPWRDPEALVVTQMEFGDARFTLRLRDAQAALNLNAADEEMLLGFFSQGLGVDFAQAQRISQAIMDWKDPDDLPLLNGGERDEYLKANMPVLPSNRGFAELDELRHVMGMTQEIYDGAVPYLTLRGSARINVNAAPEPVLLSLPGMTPAAVLEIMRLRESGIYPNSVAQLLNMIPSGAGRTLDAERQRLNQRTIFRTDEVEIISDGHVEGSSVEARVRLIVVRSEEGALVVTRVFN
jgi:type II secretory pathway component PulK